MGRLLPVISGKCSQIVVVDVRLSAEESLINSHIYPPNCSESAPLPAVCKCGRRDSCGRPRFFRWLKAAIFDTEYTFICVDAKRYHIVCLHYSCNYTTNRYYLIHCTRLE